MEKVDSVSRSLEGQPRPRVAHQWRRPMLLLPLAAAGLYLFTWNRHDLTISRPSCGSDHHPYGLFPRPDDPFHFLPATEGVVPPPLDDHHPLKTWASQYDPDPTHWSWGKETTHEGSDRHGHDPYAGRGIFLAGYIDVPMDYTNETDTRIVRLSVTKYQVSGLARRGHHHHDSSQSAGRKSEVTLIIEPGGPGGSGSSFAWRSAEKLTEQYTSGKYDVLGWDPRGVNQSLPAAACFPSNADRDRWSLLIDQTRAANTTSPLAQLELADTWYGATLGACKEMLGDFPRFVSTAFVARDLDRIRSALGEDKVTGYFVSYGTGIGQTYANMFPNHVGHLILDGTEYVRDHRLVGGFGWTSLDNVTDAWNDGFLGECVAAGPDHCALAQPTANDKGPVTLKQLQARMSDLVLSLAARPMPAYLPSTGPSLVTHAEVIGAIYNSLYNPLTWPGMAQALADLERGNTTRAAQMLDKAWEYDPLAPCIPLARRQPASAELFILVVCADLDDGPKPWSHSVSMSDGDSDLPWFADLWQNMTSQDWISGDSRFVAALMCRHFKEHIGSTAETYRGDLNHTLSHPVLLIAESYDPATPLRNGRRLLHEMGDNARLIHHHGYGHSSRDTSACTNSIAKEYILTGKVPEASETDCYADEKPYRYNQTTAASIMTNAMGGDPDLQLWREHVREMREQHALF